MMNEIGKEKDATRKFKILVFKFNFFGGFLLILLPAVVKVKAYHV
jgi:hypothetical protein